MSVTALVGTAFAAASGAHGAVLEQWILASHRVGSLLPGSHLMLSLQEIGYLDVLLRSMEDEALSNIDLQVARFDEVLALGGMQMHQLSGIWVGACYEACRLLKSRGLIESEVLKRLEHDLAILRMPLDKHEIAQDRLLDSPLALGVVGPEGTLSEVTEYDKADKRGKAHAMPSALTQRGSVTWQAIDVDRGSVSARWIERRQLAEELLAFFTSLTGRKDEG